MMRERGLSSWVMSSSWPVAFGEVGAFEAISSRLGAVETWTWEGPSCVLSRSKAVLAALLTIVRYVDDCDAKNAYVSFSNVTAADCGASAASDEGVTDREVILPLVDVSIAVWHNH